VNAEIAGEIPHIDGGQPPDTEIPTSHRTAGTVIRTAHPRRSPALSTALPRLGRRDHAALKRRQ
jgi:hypothetical protein